MNWSGLMGAAACVGLLAVQPEARAATLSSPLAEAGVSFRQAGSGVPACPDPGAPLHDLAATMYYEDPAGSMIDAERHRQNRAAVKPLNDFTHQLLQQSDAYMRTGTAASARCAFGLLHSWAITDALTGKLDLQAQFHRNWATNAFATAYLIVQAQAGAEPEEDRRVRDWLVRLCQRNQKLAKRVSNNHLAWCAASCASVGVASSRQDLLEWSVDAAKRVLDHVDDLGTLPAEIERGARALSYHNFALEALVATAEMALMNGSDLYSYRDGALHRLADFVIRNAADPGEASELAGAKQSWRGATSGRFVWAEPYYRRFKDRRLPMVLQALRPMRHDHFGGNATLMYGLPLPEVPPQAPDSGEGQAGGQQG
jgi:poly(beta-D-mannuronate) lyase